MQASDHRTELRALYRQEFRRLHMPRWARAGAFAAFCINSAFAAVDYFVYPEHLALFLGLRVALDLLFIVVYLRPERRPAASILAMPIALCFAMLVMIQQTGGAMSEYYVGLILVLVGMGVLFPLTAAQSMLICASVSLPFLFLPVVSGSGPESRTFVLHAIFIVSAALESVVSCSVLENLRLQQFVQLREIEIARDHLKQMDVLKSRFTANVHHELRTPLTLMLAPVEAMLSNELGSVPDHLSSYLRTMHANGLRLLKLINNLLDLAKLENRQFQLHRRRLDVSSVVRAVLGGARPMAERKQIELACDLEPGLAPICADVDALEKVLVNLLGNSLKFTPEGGRIAVAARSAGTSVQLTVQDSGIGVPPDQLERIFDRFAQADGSATRRYEGTGIGLSLVRELLELHGGRCWAESAGPGRGTTLHALFPPGEPDEGAEEEILIAEEASQASAARALGSLRAEDSLASVGETPASTELAGAAASAAPDAEDEARPEVLVVDDNPEMRRLLADLLRNEFRVRTASDGRAALESVRAQPVDLVLTDIMMPEMTGTELCAELKSDPATRGIPLILVTSKAEREMKVAGLELGADDYITKPFHPRELMARARSFVRLRQLQRTLEARNQTLVEKGTQLERALADLSRTQTELVHRKKIEALGRLVAGVAHELNNPLNFVLGNIHFIQQYLTGLLDVVASYDRALRAVSTQAAGEADRIRAEAGLEALLADLRSTFDGCMEGITRATGLVQDLRVFSRLDRMEKLRVDLHESLDATLRLLRDRLQGIEVRKEYGELPGVECLSGQINQVFMNLLSNAADAMGDRGTLTVRTQRVASTHVAIEVEDTGSGIEPEILDRIADPFFTTKEVGKGTGLGLAIAYEVIARHDGRIRIRSEVGRGTCFRVELPIDAPIRPSVAACRA